MEGGCVIEEWSTVRFGDMWCKVKTFLSCMDFGLRVNVYGPVVSFFLLFT